MDSASKEKSLLSMRLRSRLMRALALVSMSFVQLGWRSALSVFHFYIVSFFRSDPTIARAIYVSTLGQRILLRSADMGTFFEVFLRRQYDMSQLPDYFAGLFRDFQDMNGTIILDCGANIGLSALWFAHMAPLTTIYAFEPAPENLDLLRQNVRPCPNIHVIDGAVWHEDTTLRLRYDAANPAGSNIDASGAVATRAFSIHQFLAGRPNHSYLVKIDIEGAEDGLFSCNAQWVRNASILVIELHDWLYPGESRSRNLLRCIADSDFDVLLSNNNLFCFNKRGVVIPADSEMRTESFAR